MALPPTPSSGPIGISDINLAIGQTATFTEELSFLNSLLLAPASSPNMGVFYSKAYFQANNQGACDNGNCTNNCNCGNIQCTNCFISGTTNCLNCQPQAYLQTNCNCACTYNCVTSATALYNCNCACNCSKIICAKLYEFGYMDPNVWVADQKYGKWLRENDRRVYRGYIRWARTVTAWMDGKGPDCFLWLPKEKRAMAQKEAITRMALRIGIPWSEHMAYLMGARPQDNLRGRVLMTIGKPISRLIDYIPHRRGHRILTLWGMWALFWMSHWTASAIVSVNKFSVEGVKKWMNT
jgi:hypothetical protein